MFSDFYKDILSKFKEELAKETSELKKEMLDNTDSVDKEESGNSSKSKALGVVIKN